MGFFQPHFHVLIQTKRQKARGLFGSPSREPKFARSGKIRRISNTLMQVWMTGYHGFLLEAIAMAVC